MNFLTFSIFEVRLLTFFSEFSEKFSANMRITSTLYRQHIGFMFKRHWQVQGKRRVQETNTARDLEQLGKIVTDPKDFLAIGKWTGPRFE